MESASKTRLLLGLLPSRPLEFYDRVRTVLEVRWDRLRESAPAVEATDVKAVASALGDELGVLTPYLHESALAEIEASVTAGMDRLSGRSPFTRKHDADRSLARLAYAVARATAPQVVVETGVAHGVTSAFLLKALDRNGRGTLHSVDLPPLAAEASSYMGILVPDELKGRWRLNRGTATRVLPNVLSGLDSVDLFLHDSLHTRRHIRFELETVWPLLRPGGVVIADDVGENRAFVDFARSADVTFHAFVREEGKGGLFGVAVKRR